MWTQRVVKPVIHHPVLTSGALRGVTHAIGYVECWGSRGSESLVDPQIQAPKAMPTSAAAPSSSKEAALASHPGWLCLSPKAGTQAPHCSLVQFNLRVSPSHMHTRGAEAGPRAGAHGAGCPKENPASASLPQTAQGSRWLLGDTDNGLERGL